MRPSQTLWDDRNCFQQDFFDATLGLINCLGIQYQQTQESIVGVTETKSFSRLSDSEDFGEMNRFRLQPELVEKTVAQLHGRIEERFPNSGLGKVCAALQQIALDAERKSAWLGRPLYWLRILALLMIGIIITGLIGQFLLFKWTAEETIDWTELVQGMEAAVNEIVLIAAGVFFMLTLESRYKRRKGLKAIHELRSMAHVIDMHQLTKDPERSQGKSYQATKSSPTVTMDNFQLRRYLDYCSEMLSLTGKIAAVYLNRFDDSVMASAVNDVETLTTDLSRKIWQKIMILHSFEQGQATGLVAPEVKIASAATSSVKAEAGKDPASKST